MARRYMTPTRVRGGIYGGTLGGAISGMGVGAVEGALATAHPIGAIAGGIMGLGAGAMIGNAVGRTLSHGAKAIEDSVRGPMDSRHPRDKAGKFRRK